MTITQTVEIPADRRKITLDVPREIPAGKTIIAFTPIPEAVERNVPRKNWNEAFKKMNQNGDDKLIFSDNNSDFEWEWK